jgi:hypothetical protein
MESHILQLLGTDESSDQNKYRNNVQYSKKPYPLAKVKGKKAKQSQRALTKQERAPLIEDAAKVSRNFHSYDALELFKT